MNALGDAMLRDYAVYYYNGCIVEVGVQMTNTNFCH